MKRTTRFVCLSTTIALLITILTCPTFAQQSDVLKRATVYRLPEMDKAIVKSDVTFKTAGSEALKMDLYYPAAHKSGSKRPAVIFLNGVGNPAGPASKLKEWGQYTSWPRLIAASGMIAISHDSRQSDSSSDAADLIAYVRSNASSLDIDESRIGIWSCSANVRAAVPLVMQQDRGYIRAAVFYYGVMPGEPTRLDLPMLVVRAGHDVPGINKGIDAFAAKALAADAQLTLVNYVDGQHGFDLLDDNDQSREVIRQTLDFMKFHLSKTSYEAARRAPTPAQFLDTLTRQGAQKALWVYAEARKTAPDDVLFKENTLNAMGYELLQNGKTKDAIELFKINVASYPESANVYDSLSEAYEADGNKDLAVQNAEKALQFLGSENAGVPDQLKAAIKEGSGNRIKKLKSGDK
jgi:dienelactone hydrolase